MTHTIRIGGIEHQVNQEDAHSYRWLASAPACPKCYSQLTVDAEPDSGLVPVEWMRYGLYVVCEHCWWTVGLLAEVPYRIVVKR